MTKPAFTDSKETWLAARRELLAQEKAHTRAGDELAQLRRAMPWLRVTRPYAFDTPMGRQTLSELFAGRSQLIVYHFMFAPDWGRRLQELFVLDRPLRGNHPTPGGSGRNADHGFPRAARQTRSVQAAHGVDTPVGVVPGQ